MPINPQIPLLAGQGVPQVKSLSDVMTDVARIKTAEAQVRRLDAVSAQEAENARLAQEERERATRVEGIAKMFAHDEGQIGPELIKRGYLPEATRYNQYLAQYRQSLAQQTAASLAMERAAATVTANTLEAIDDEASYNYAIHSLETTERGKLQPGQPGLAADFKGVPYEQAVSSGLLARMTKFARVQAGASGEQIDAFEAFAKDMENAGKAHAVLGTVRNQQDLDVVNKLFDAGRVPAKLRNTLPRVWTEGLAEEHKRIAEALRGATATQATTPSLQSEKVMAPDGKGGMAEVLANFNPKDGKYYAPDTGQVITGAQPVSSTGQTTDEKTIEEAARNIVNNPRDLVSLRSVTTMRGEQRLQLFNAIKKLSPNFNIANVDRQIKFLDGYEDPKGRAASNRGSMNNILMHAADLSDVNKEYRRSNVRLANTAINKLANQYSDVYTRYMVPLTVLQNEIALYFAGGYAPDVQEKKDWDRILTGDATPNQIEAFAKSLIHVGLRRADTHNQQFKTMMGFDDPNLITPDAMVAGKKLGLGSEISKYGSGGKIGDKPFVGVFPGGEEGFNTQAELDAFIKQAKEQHGVTVTPKGGAEAASIEKVDWIWDPATKTMKKVGG